MPQSDALEFGCGITVLDPTPSRKDVHALGPIRYDGFDLTRYGTLYDGYARIIGRAFDGLIGHISYKAISLALGLASERQ